MWFIFLRKLDLFGAEVSLKYEGKNKYTTRFGGIATLTVACLLITFLYQQVAQIYRKDNPNIIYQQNFVDNPSRYNLTPNKFSFMIGLLNSNYLPFIDNEIFTIEALFEYKIKDISGSYSFNSVPLTLGPCTMEDFQMPEVSEYFLNQIYQNLYCIKSQSQLYLQGQYDQYPYSVIRIKILECVSASNCKQPEERQKLLKQSMAQIYYTDRIISLQNFENPFRAVGKTQFYNIFYDYLQTSNFIFSNTHVTDDSGLFLKTSVTQTELTFVTDRLQLSAKTDNEFFECSIYLDKDKEDTYFRSYKKIPDGLSQIGGTFQILFFTGSLLIKPYNKVKLQRRLYREIYSEENKKINNKDRLQNRSQSKNLSIIQGSRDDSFGNFNQQKQTLQSTHIQSQEGGTLNRRSLYQQLKEYLTDKFCCKKQPEHLENLQCIKSLINLQIQFSYLKRLFYEKYQFGSKPIQLQPSIIFDNLQQPINQSNNLMSQYTKETMLPNLNNSAGLQQKKMTLTNSGVCGTYTIDIPNCKLEHNLSNQLSNQTFIQQQTENANDSSTLFVNQRLSKCKVERQQQQSLQPKDQHQNISSKNMNYSQFIVNNSDLEENMQDDQGAVDKSECQTTIVQQQLENYIQKFNSISSIQKKQQKYNRKFQLSQNLYYQDSKD